VGALMTFAAAPRRSVEAEASRLARFRRRRLAPGNERHDGVVTQARGLRGRELSVMIERMLKDGRKRSAQDGKVCGRLRCIHPSGEDGNFIELRLRRRRDYLPGIAEDVDVSLWGRCVRDIAIVGQI
jgi:hypothetical protein